MAKTQYAQVVITANAAVAKQIMDELARRTDALKQKMLSLDTTTKAGAKEFKKLEKQLVAYNSATTQNIKGTERVKKAINNLSGTPLKELRRALAAAKTELGKFSEKDGAGLKKARANVQALQNQINKLEGSVGRANKQFGAFSTTIRNISAYFGLFTVVSKAISLWNTFLKKNFQLSDSMADIRKVSLMAYEDIAKLEGALAKLDTRTNLEGLNKILYAGAKLGMAKYGVEGMQAFVKASNQVNVALREDLGDEALTALSKFTEVMGLIPKLGVERAMLKTGSAIFKLAATSTASAGPIINFSKRLTGVARTAGITADQILALGSAADSMMLMPEVASTAFSKLITSLQRNPKAIEKSLGMEQGTINNLFKGGNAMEAIVEILKAMHDKGNMHALNDVFKDLGSDGARLISVMVTMAKNVKMLEDHLETAKDAFQEGYAVTQEYLIQQQTAQALMERASNMWEKAFVNPEGVDNVKEMAKAWYDVSKQLTQSEASMTMLGGVLKTLLYLITSALKFLPAVLVMLGVRGLFGALIGLKGALFGVGQASIFATRAGTGFVATLKAMTATMWANWISAIVLVVATLYLKFKEMNRELPKTVKFMEGFKKVANAMDGSYGKEKGYLEALVKDINRLGTKTKERATLIAEFNKRYKPYLDHLLTEKSTAEEVAKAYKEVNKQLQMKSLLELKQEDYEKYYNPAFRRSVERMETYGNKYKGDKPRLHGFIMDAIDSQNKPGGLKIGDSSFAKALAQRLGVSQDFVAEAMKYRSAPTVPTKAPDKVSKTRFVQKQTMTAAGPVNTLESVTEKGRDYTQKEQQFIAALQTATQYYATANINSKLWQKWKYLLKDMKPEDLGNLDDDGNGNGDGNDTTRDEASKARARANALIANITAFYENQKRKYLEWVAEQNKDGEKIYESQQAEMLSQIDQHMNQTLGAARESIATLSKDWEEQMPKMLEHGFDKLDETDNRLIETIQQANIEELHNLFASLASTMEGGQERIRENLGALLNEIFKNGTKNLREAAEKMVQQQRNLQKILAKYDYTGSVNREYRNRLSTEGLLPTNTALNQDPKGAPQKQNVAYDKMTAMVRENIVALHELDIETAEGQNKFKSMLSVGSEAFDFQKLSIKETIALYRELIQYYNEYVEAEKKGADERKKVNDFDWGRSYTYKTRTAQTDETQATIDSNKLLPNKGRKWTQANGFRNNLDDPEIRLLQIKMQLEAEHLQFLMKRNATEEQLNEQWRNAADAANEYSQRIMESISERMEMMEQWTDPLVTFGGAMGEAFAKMGEDAEEGAQAVQDALKDMLRSWGEITIRIIAERMAQSMQQSFYNQMEESEEESHQERMSDIRTSGGKKGRNTAISVAKSILNAKLQWNKKEKKQDEQTQNDITDSRADAADAMVGIEKNAGSAMLNASIQTGATLLAQKRAQDQAEVEGNADKTKANVTMSLADALGKCFAQLGPIGGAIAAAGVEALLMGLLNWALSKAFSSKSSSASSAPKVNTKLVSGMLTYDQGNLKQMYLGNDGKLYAAKSEEQLPTGIVTQPVATTINGQPSLVGERGPELVVGRETTAAMMQNAPQLLQALLDYDKNRRLGALPAYDRGNLSEISTANTSDLSPTTQSPLSEELLTQLLYYLQHPVAPNINMYGREGLHAKMQQADRFMKGK